MTRPFSLSPEQRDQFERRGVVLIPGLFSADGVRDAREAVLRRLAQRGLTQAGGWRLDAQQLRPGQAWWNVSQPLASAAIGDPQRSPELEALGKEPALAAAAEALLGGPFDRTGHQRLRVLVNLPDPAPWTMPAGWHTDSPHLASGLALGVQLFAFLDVVDPGGGGTMVAAGSHRLFGPGRFMTQPEVRDRIRRRPFFRRFDGPPPADPDERMRLMGETHHDDGDVTLEVTELTGQPGDAWFTDLRVAHTGRPNGADHPRLMITRPFISADRVREVRQRSRGP